MENFIRKFSSIPTKFIDDFFNIAKENYNKNDFMVNFDLVYDWLDTDKSDLKKVLIKNFNKNIDYTLEKIKVLNRNRGSNYVDRIMITPECFKHLCMISHTKKAKEVRLYYLDMEHLIKKYHIEIQESLEEQLNILKENQKPKLNIRSGIIYILEAQNNEDTREKIKKFKIGKTSGIGSRLSTYNTGNANDINPIWIMKTDDIHAVEKCVKAICKSSQYRKYKEIYDIDADTLKKVITECDILIEGVKNAKEIHIGKLSRSYNIGKRKIFIKIERYDKKVNICQNLRK